MSASDPCRTGARQAVMDSASARAFAECVAQLYLQREFTMHEIRELVTLGLQMGVERDYRPVWFGDVR